MSDTTAPFTAACGYLPSAPYVGGPLDGSSAQALRRKTETVHPQHRTAEGRSVCGSARPDGPHYAHREHGWAGYYEYVPGGPNRMTPTEETTPRTTTEHGDLTLTYDDGRNCRSCGADPFSMVGAVRVARPDGPLCGECADVADPVLAAVAGGLGQLDYALNIAGPRRPAAAEDTHSAVIWLMQYWREVDEADAEAGRPVGVNPTGVRVNPDTGKPEPYYDAAPMPNHAPPDGPWTPHKTGAAHVDQEPLIGTNAARARCRG